MLFAAINDGIIGEINEGGIWDGAAAEGRLRGTGRLSRPSLGLSARDGLTVCGRSGRDPQHVALSSRQTTVRRFQHPRYFRESILEMGWFDKSGVLGGSALEIELSPTFATGGQQSQKAL